MIKALEKSEQSGFVENFDSEQNLTELHRKWISKNGTQPR
jgi:hypothetical protein